MSDESLGPFRRDGRTRFVTETRYDEAAQRALRTGATLEFPAYVAAIALGPAALALLTSSPWMLGISALLLFIAWKSHQSFALARTKSISQGPRPLQITEDGIMCDGVLGPVRWDWDVVVDARVTDAHVVLRFANREMVALPASGTEAERMVSFVRERSQLRITENPGRLLFLLAILYATSVAAAAALLY